MYRTYEGDKIIIGLPDNWFKGACFSFLSHCQSLTAPWRCLDNPHNYQPGVSNRPQPIGLNGCQGRDCCCCCCCLLAYFSWVLSTTDTTESGEAQLMLGPHHLKFWWGPSLLGLEGSTPMVRCSVTTRHARVTKHNFEKSATEWWRNLLLRRVFLPLKI